MASSLLTGGRYEKLRSNFNTVVESMKMEGLTDRLFQRDVLTMRQKNKVEVERTAEEKASKLLTDYILRSDDDQYDAFCEELENLGQDTLVRTCLRPDVEKWIQRQECRYEGGKRQELGRQRLEENMDVGAGGDSRTVGTNQTPLPGGCQSRDRATEGTPPTAIFTSVPYAEQETGSASDYSEEDEIDLTGPSISTDLTVKSCTIEFYKKHKKNAYPMYKEKRGKVLVINVNQVKNQECREGTDLDRDSLKEVWTKLQFEVTVYNDEDGLTGEGIRQKLKDFSQDLGHRDAQACVVCLLSHGTYGAHQDKNQIKYGDFIYGTDGAKVPLCDILDYFNNEKCERLHSKPKMFFIQACRGRGTDHGVVMEDAVPDSYGQRASVSDYIVAQPTAAGFRAWRNKQNGSWFIQELVRTLGRYAHEKDLIAILNRVNNKISRMRTTSLQFEDNNKCEMSEYRANLRKDRLYLFPGIVHDH